MFLSMDEPEAVISVIEKYSDFKAMYGQIYEICRNIEEVMGMFSKELRELDRNTVQLMIDEMQEELNQVKRKVEEEKQKAEEEKQKAEEERQKAERKELVLVYKCRQEKLNNLYYQVKSKGDVQHGEKPEILHSGIQAADRGSV